jgi:pimeloyl-ACP methyl ester carboxylesterase
MLAGKALAGLVLLVASAGLVYQWAALRRDARRYPAPGRFVAVQGHRMHIDCAGQGSPTVIFDAGLGDSYTTWALVQPEVAKFTRACSYDRAGMGWSELGEAPRTSEQIASELQALLDEAGEKGPFLLVGHSFGGYNVRALAARERGQIAGIVLVDASHPDQLNRFPPYAQIENYIPHVTFGMWTTPFGIPRILGWCRDDYTFPGEPAAWSQAAPEAIALDCRQPAWRTTRAELQSFRESGRQVAAEGALPNIPLVVLSHDPQVGTAPGTTAEEERLWSQMQEELRALSPNSRRIIAKGSMHYVQIYRPELVIEAIKTVLDAARTAQSIAAPTVTR